MRVAALPLTLLLVTGFGVAVAEAGCPLNTISAFGTTVTTSDPARAISISIRCGIPEYPQTATATAGYDLPNGVARADAFAPSACYYASAAATTHDTFTVVGLPTPGTISFTARILVSNTGTGGIFTLREGNTNSVTSGRVQGYASTVISVAVTRHVGESFDLYMSATAIGDPGGGSIYGTLSFPDLPSGYGVISCQGFVSDPSVPVLHTSWGRLKTIYR